MDSEASELASPGKLDQPDPNRRIRIGALLNDTWHLDVLLGFGGMASVYAATHKNGTRAAIKILHPELSANRAA